MSNNNYYHHQLTIITTCKAMFTWDYFVGENGNDISGAFASQSYLGHTLQIAMILFMSWSPRKPRQERVGVGGSISTP
jgi:hypothetical protein